jgi:hypothetical protein
VTIKLWPALQPTLDSSAVSIGPETLIFAAIELDIDCVKAMEHVIPQDTE